MSALHTRYCYYYRARAPLRREEERQLQEEGTPRDGGAILHTGGETLPARSRRPVSPHCCPCTEPCDLVRWVQGARSRRAASGKPGLCSSAPAVCMGAARGGCASAQQTSSRWSRCAQAEPALRGRGSSSSAESSRLSRSIKVPGSSGLFREVLGPQRRRFRFCRPLAGRDHRLHRALALAGTRVALSSRWLSD